MFDLSKSASVQLSIPINDVGHIGNQWGKITPIPNTPNYFLVNSRAQISKYYISPDSSSYTEEVIDTWDNAYYKSGTKLMWHELVEGTTKYVLSTSHAHFTIGDYSSPTSVIDCCNNNFQLQFPYNGGNNSRFRVFIIHSGLKAMVGLNHQVVFFDLSTNTIEMDFQYEEPTGMVKTITKIYGTKIAVVGHQKVASFYAFNYETKSLVTIIPRHKDNTFKHFSTWLGRYVIASKIDETAIILVDLKTIWAPENNNNIQIDNSSLPRNNNDGRTCTCPNGEILYSGVMKNAGCASWCGGGIEGPCQNSAGVWSKKIANCNGYSVTYDVSDDYQNIGYDDSSGVDLTRYPIVHEGAV